MDNSIAQQMSKFVNSTLCGEDEMRQAAKEMAANHPTLQQKTMRLMCMFIEEMAAKPYADARNKPAVEKAKLMVEANFKASVKHIMDTEHKTEEEAKKIAEKYFKLSGDMPLV